MAHQNEGFPGTRKEVNGKEDMGESEETKRINFAKACQERLFLYRWLLSLLSQPQTHNQDQWSSDDDDDRGLYAKSRRTPYLSYNPGSWGFCALLGLDRRWT